ncbi:MAG TPA: patatin-like phospholipase family protein [Spirochaetales bacterium]|nr:patatin-like phospholipase family protein [Spirochaetales bacterium]HRY55198.1 patatin-like phospholipase family protein [Spirochaetia bacterium]HRZ64600.1 patatin-like phospholipase family protein [Spirochaetia bacterium]
MNAIQVIRGGFGRLALPLALATLLASALPAQEAARPEAKRPRVAVVLSGGSAFGIAHVGVLRSIEEAGIPIDLVLGTSMGSLVGGLYVAGYSPDDMKRLFTELDWSTVFSERREIVGSAYEREKRRRYPLKLGFDSRGPKASAGFLSGQKVLSLATEYVLHDLVVRDFDELPVPYRAVAADILTGERVVLSSGSLAEAMRSSMSIPGIFSPYELGGRKLVDGGIVDNMPVELARELGADIVIAVESREGAITDPGKLESGMAVTGQTFSLYVEENMRPSRAAADLLVKPDVSGLNQASFDQAAELVRRGEAAGEAARPALDALAARISRERSLVAPEAQPSRSAYREPPVMGGLRVSAASSEDAERGRAAFEAFVGERLDRRAVGEAINSLYASGRYKLVKFDLEPLGAAGQTRGVLSLEPAEIPPGAFMLGSSIRTVVSRFTAPEAYSTLAVFYRGLAGTGFDLFAELSLGTTTGLYAELRESIGESPFYVLPFARAESQSEQSQSNRELGSWSLFRRIGAGGDLVAELGSGGDIRLGYSIESARGSELSDGASGSYARTLGSMGAALRYDGRPGSFFPERGFHVLARGRWVDPRFGGELSYAFAECRAGAVLPLSRRLGLGLETFAGTDFRGILEGATAMPEERLFALNAPGIFYGLEARPEAGRGEHVFAGALELRVSLGRMLPLFEADYFALANASAGTATAGELGAEDLPADLKWGASLGLGARLSPNVGALLALSYVDDGNPIEPSRLALTFIFGSFDLRLEDLR